MDCFTVSKLKNPEESSLIKKDKIENEEKNNGTQFPATASLSSKEKERFM
jgi:hypothetical protein